MIVIILQNKYFEMSKLLRVGVYKENIEGISFIVGI